MRIITLSLVKFLRVMLLQICIIERIKMSQDIFLCITTLAFKNILKHSIFFLNKIHGLSLHIFTHVDSMAFPKLFLNS